MGPLDGYTVSIALSARRPLPEVRVLVNGRRVPHPLPEDSRTGTIEIPIHASADRCVICVR